MSKEFGLDKSLSEQLLIYGAKVLCVDLGFCYLPGKPVLELILEKAPHRRLKRGDA
jgi:ABC-type dipeptide/oligopeptide/nickel transport system permease component